LVEIPGHVEKTFKGVDWILEDGRWKVDFECSGPFAVSQRFARGSFLELK
jgi:hypothetical protein